jgi:hypothetical protein
LCITPALVKVILSLSPLLPGIVITVHLLPVLCITVPGLLLPLTIGAVLPVAILIPALYISIPVGIDIVLLGGWPSIAA